MKFYKKIFSFLLIIVLFSALAFSLGKKDKSSDSTETEKVEIAKEHFKIDLFLDTKRPNPNNHFNWQTKKQSYKDSFDAVSGASKVHSTKTFREAAYDKGSKSLKTPRGLRNLCLFAVANPELLKQDNFSAKQEGSKITIEFTHRENSYIIESDETGYINVPEGFFVKLKEVKKEKKAEEAKPEETKAEETKSEEAKTEATKSEDEKPEEEQKQEVNIPEGFQKDEPAESLNAIFTGKLKATLSAEGILTLKGKLNLSERKKEEPKKETDETASEPKTEIAEEV